MPARPSCYDDPVNPTVPVVGIFVGGRGSRMGGRAKSELRAPDTGERLVERTLRVASEAGLDCVLVGSHPDMVSLGRDTPQVEDAPPGIGPLGGLLALLRFAGQRHAIAIGVDMPFVTTALVARLSRDPSRHEVLAPRDRDAAPWDALFARHDSARVLPVAERAVAEGVRSFQALFARLDVAEFHLDADERALLRDWDAPDDIVR
jgi:molybdopterin-guanine dinucleotide biosynthesis protein A